MKVLFLENLPYESDVRVGSHHYAARFARDAAEVLWVSHPLSPLHFVRRTKRDFEQRLRAWREGPLESDGLRWYAPMVALPPANAPVLGSRFVYRGAGALSFPRLGRVLAGAGFGAPDVVWLTNPYYEALSASLDARVRVVRVADDSASFAGVSPAVREAEERAIERADVVFAASAHLRDRLARVRPDALWLPNGVEFERFNKPAPEPPEYADAPRPRILYVGAQEYWFDAELVAECARAVPHAAVFLVGPVSMRFERALGLLPNVHLLGPRPYAALPGYVQHADLGIVPFIRDEMIDAVHPIKVYEYLAGGLPVVAVRWRELERMAAPIRLADRSEFVAAVAAELEEPTHPREARVAYAAANSWDSRYAAARERIEEVLQRAG
ncbi:MAG: glycosyltransferase [Anaerosomatales bacterium]|nr:glycosyltransferase [Anaerosomatales bacterium]